MKKIFYQIAIFVALACMSSCDNLDLSPEDYNGAGNFWKNEAQVSGFVSGVHYDMRQVLYKNFYHYGECRGATLATGTSCLGTSMDFSTMVSNSLSEESTGVSDWGGLYKCILQVNYLIENLENGCEFLNESSRTYYKGQAYGIRAFYYFWLYRSYGGVPLETSVEVTNGSFGAPDLYKARATAEEVLQQIKNDVKASEEGFTSAGKTINDCHMWSADATQMLKADAYLWSAKVTTGNHTAEKSDLQIAKNALEKLMSKYSLESDFNALYGNLTKKNKETIFSLYFDKNEKHDSGFFSRFIYTSKFNGYNVLDKDGNIMPLDVLDARDTGWYRNEYRVQLINSFDETDSRRAATFFEFYVLDSKTGLKTQGSSLKKYLGHTDKLGTHFYDADVILYRYADAVLMMAEIENSLSGKCATYINEIRERAYGDNFTEEMKYTDGDFAANEMAILKERDKEFVGEGKRWFDLIRLKDATGKPLAFSLEAAYANNGETVAFPVLKESEKYKVLWPIERTLMANDPLLKQTVDYPTAM